MTKTVMIGSNAVKMTAVAGVDIIYQQIFREDPLKIQAGFNGDDSTGADAIPLFERMAFVMAKAAEAKSYSELAKLTEGDFLEWLCQFERSEFIAAIGDIAGVYAGMRATSSQEKKEADE